MKLPINKHYILVFPVCDEGVENDVANKLTAKNGWCTVWQ
jgi:hypothetical protein